MGDNKTIDRQSNIELLRIIAMFAILFGHFIGYGYGDIADVQETYKTTINQSILAFLTIHVNLFLLITGYFGIRLRWASFIRLFVKCTFYAIGIYVIWTLVTGQSMHLAVILKRCLFFCRTSPWWFIENYFYLMLFSPLLNICIKGLDKTRYKKILLLLAFINLVLGGFLKSSLNVTGFTIHHFVFIYFIGGYIRRYGLFENVSSKILLLVYILCVSFIFAGFASGYEVVRGYINPFVLLGSMVVFCLFLRVKFRSRAINWVASSSLAVYLLHDDDTIIRYIYIERMHDLYNFTSEPYFYLPLTFLSAVLFFCCAILIDKLVGKLLLPLTKFLAEYDVMMMISKRIN